MLHRVLFLFFTWETWCAGGAPAATRRSAEVATGKPARAAPQRLSARKEPVPSGMLCTGSSFLDLPRRHSTDRPRPLNLCKIRASTRLGPIRGLGDSCSMFDFAYLRIPSL